MGFSQNFKNRYPEFLGIKVTVHSGKIWSEDMGLRSSGAALIFFFVGMHSGVDGNHAILSAKHGSGPGDFWPTPQYCSTCTGYVPSVQLIDPLALIISSAVQNRKECHNDVVHMWQLRGCPKLWPILWCWIGGEGSCFCHHVMQWIGCCYPAHPARDRNLHMETGAFMARALTQPSWASWRAEGFQCSKKGSKVKPRRIRKGSPQDKEWVTTG